MRHLGTASEDFMRPGRQDNLAHARNIGIGETIFKVSSHRTMGMDDLLSMN
jgi:hypothetical protein